MAWTTIEEKRKELENLKAMQEILQAQLKALKLQRNGNFNAVLEESIFNTQKHLTEISRRKHSLDVSIKNQTERQSRGRKYDENSAVFQTYGKHLKDLTREEYNEYQSRTARKQRKLKSKGA
jgi:hypothetical protein